MTNGEIIRTILAFHGYQIVTYGTSRTGTNAGQSEDAILYDIEAVSETGDAMEIYEPGWDNALLKIFSHLHGTELEIAIPKREEQI